MRKREGEREREREKDRGREKQREKKRERCRIWWLYFFKGVIGALVPFSYQVIK